MEQSPIPQNPHRSADDLIFASSQQTINLAGGGSLASSNFTPTNKISVTSLFKVRDLGNLTLEQAMIPNQFAWQLTAAGSSQTILYFTVNGVTDETIDFSVYQASFPLSQVGGTAIATWFNAAMVILGYNITLSYDVSLNQYTFVNPGPDNFVFHFGNSTTSSAKTPNIFGSLKKDVEVLAAATIYTGNANFGPTCVFMKVSDRKQQLASNMGGNACFIIPIEVNYNEMITYTSEEGCYNTVSGCEQGNNFSNYEISLTDEENNVFPLYNCLWTCTFRYISNLNSTY